MKLIRLHSKKYPGLFTLVDDEDYDRLNQYQWGISTGSNKMQYACRRFTNPLTKKRVIILMHREILGITDRKIHTDHINHITLNNCKWNIRSCTPSQNLRNQKPAKNNTSGYKGVTYFKDYAHRLNPWGATCTLDGKLYNIGTFPTREAAARAYDKVVTEKYGEYALTNKALGLLKD